MCSIRFGRLFRLVCLLTLAAVRGEEATPRLIGFTEARALDQVALEKKFDALLKAEDQQAWLEQMASAPNHVGSPHDQTNAEFLLAHPKVVAARDA